MGGGGSSAAPQFNAGQVAQQQQQANVDTGISNAYLTNTNQVTPYGNLTYSQTGTANVGGRDIPQFTATQTLSPEQQAIYNKTTGLQKQGLDTAGNVLGQVQNSVNQPLNFDGIPQLPTDQTQLRNDAYHALTARSTQDLDRQQQAQRVQLANQGIAAGSEAYNNAMTPFDRSRVDASNQATVNAGNIASQNLTQAQTIRNQDITERQAVRNQPLMDYQTLLGASGGVQQPSWATPTQAQIPQTDMTSPYIAQYQGQQNAYNQGVASNNAMMGGLFGLGGSALMAGGVFL